MHLSVFPCLLSRDNLEPDLQPWRRRGPLPATAFLDLLHAVHTAWPEYRRNFLAIVVVRNSKFTWWAYPTARSWCTARVRQAGQ